MRGRPAAIPWRRVLPPALVAALLLVAAPDAHGHARSASWSSWSVEGRDARVVLRIDALDLTRLPWRAGGPGPLPGPLGRYLAEALQLRAGEERCEAREAPRVLAGSRERVRVEWRLRCPPQGELVIESSLLREVAPSHLHFVRVRGEGHAVEAVLATERPSLRLDTASGSHATKPGPSASSWGAFLVLGVEHILTGLDHLVFLFGLLLLASRPGEVATIVTGFTLAHSLTLGLAVLGRLRPEASAVEALIGLSIALVGVENAWLLAGRPRALPWAMAGLLLLLGAGAAAGMGSVPASTLAGVALFVPCYFGWVASRRDPLRVRTLIALAFGLVHGFGFAGVLSELSLPPERLARALLGFNLGVEMGQLALVALAWPLLRGLQKLGGETRSRLFAEMATACVAGLGIFWFVSRAYYTASG